MSTPAPPTDTRTMKNDAALIADLKRAVSELFDAREELAATKARLGVAMESLQDIKAWCEGSACVECGKLKMTNTDCYDYVRKALVALDAHAGDAAKRPKIVCLCGSTRFFEAFQEASLKETVAGKIVLSIGCNLRSDHQLWSDPSERADIKERLDELHKRKIDLADDVLVLNIGGYIGDSTRSEIDYAIAHRKPVRYLEPAGDAGGKGETP